MKNVVEEPTGIKKLLQGRTGRLLGIAFGLLALLALVWSVWSNVVPDSSVREANSPLFIDAETGKTFRVTLSAGMTLPVKSPYSGKNTGYKAELCYWTKDGQVKTEPTAVLMNEDIGKTGPTFCPDCGRLVVHHNPPAVAGGRCPPTQAEYLARRSARADR